MKEKNIEIKILTEKDFDSKETDFLFRWWSQKTHLNSEHMLPETPAFFRNNLICATVAYDGKKPIGAAAIVPCLGRSQQKLYFQDRLVVEFRSNFVHPLHERKGIGRTFIELRSEFVKMNNFLSVCVTKKSTIVNILTKRGWHPMEIFNGEFEGILSEIRNCTCSSPEKPFVGPRCEICPLFKKSVMVDYNYGRPY